MCTTITHRGPDGNGIFHSGAVGLGHNRLSIIDIDPRSNQPMRNSTDGPLICYNGEIYNYRELRSDLEADGLRFRTESDTEVLLALYEKKGIKALNELNGMFGFAIWDGKDDLLFLARDRVGIKPLYYCLTKDGIVFASEIKAILKALDTTPSIDEASIDSFMSFGYVPGDQSMFQSIKKLSPGHFLVVRNGTVTIRQYWDFGIARGEDLGFRAYKERTIELLRDSVRLQLRSDVPLGVFLSGGVDSSAVVAMMHLLGAEPIKTFSVRWDQGPYFDETPYAREVSQLFATEHYEYTMTDDDFVQFLPRFQWLMDEPVTEAAAVSLYYIAAKASNEVKVVLSGEGADEVFGGYPIYRYMQWVQRYKLIPTAVRKAFLDPLLRAAHPIFSKYVDLSHNDLAASYFGVSFYDRAVKNSVYTADFSKVTQMASAESVVFPFYKRTENLDTFSRMQYLDVKTWLVDDLLIKADRMSMAASLELRVPFLDHRFFDFSGTIPVKHLISAFESKKLLKRALEPYLPRSVLYRKKMGFPTPVATLLRGGLGAMAHDLFSSRRFQQGGYFNASSVMRLLAQHMDGTKDHHRVLWQLLVFELWRTAFLEN